MTPGGVGGGEPAHLTAFETATATVYPRRSRHRHAAVQAVLPADDAGGMVTDRGRRDDAPAFDRVEPPPCLAHLLRALSDGVARKTGRARELGARLNPVRREALALGHEDRDGQVTDVTREAEAWPATLTSQRRERRLNDRDHQRRLHALGWHHDRGHVLRFVVDPRSEPTNTRAERALPPAVIVRTRSHGSQHGAGAQAFAACTSVVRTLAKPRLDALVETLYHRFRGPDLHATPP